MEPWDGPAAIAFTNGRQIGATLDRNGLRPARYLVTNDDQVIMASEMGVLPVPEEKIVKKWRLQPGKMLLIDLEQGRIIDDDEIKAQLASSTLPDLVGRHPDPAQDLPAEIGPMAPIPKPCCAASRLSVIPRKTAGFPDSDGRQRRGSDRLHGPRHSPPCCPTDPSCCPTISNRSSRR